MNKTSTLRRSLVVLGATVGMGLLAACSDDAPKTLEPASEKPFGIERIKAEATGFAVGNMLAARTVYVFFDAQCPHCGSLWNAAKPLHDRVRFIWIPVHILSQASLAQGATLLAAAEPVALMDEHEELLLARRGGVTASSSAKDSHGAKVAANTALLRSGGVTGIPHLVFEDARGQLVQHTGSMGTAQLAALLGV